MGISLGADPEFGLLNENNGLVSAECVVGYGCHKKFGTDGCSAIAEIRPTPSEDPHVLVKNIRKVFLSGIKQYPELKNLTWKAGSKVGGYSTGGHIHFGFQKSSGLVKLLDCCLAPPALLLEKRSEAVSRKRGGHGHLSDIRKQHWGFEYRTLGSWLTSPKVATGILCLAKCIVEEYASGGSQNVPETIRPNKSKFELVDLDYFKPRMETLHDYIKRMKFYTQYAEEINFIFKLIRHDKTWFTINGLKQAWELEVAPRELPQISTSEIWGNQK